ncbi:site-specific integrase [uncultured Ruminococcus sp.]|uniref:tyrosine-type recombinase/integrase n=1 Tax=uncultured Ruminococcus sp. TaxID=165186 RepID=UPI0025D7015D|nr:site-specific integrase [uncultured Ruminococcus sp.]
MEREKSDVKCFSEDELQRIEAEAVKCYNNGKRIYRMGEIVIFLADTGLRIGEALTLEWTNINFKKKTVTVRQNMVFVKDRKSTDKSYKYIKQCSTKTKKGSRIVPLTAAAIRALMSLKGINGSTKYVFATSTGKRIYPRNIDRMFRGILKKCGIKGTGVHTLRHTFASRLFAKGVDVKTVSELLGHSEVGITYDTYIHIIQEQQAAAVDVLENVL